MAGEWMSAIEAEAGRIGVEVPEAKPDQRSGFNPVLVGRELADEGWTFARGGGRLYLYRDGRYVLGDSILRNYLVSCLGEKWLPARAEAIVKWFTDSAPELWAQPPVDKINLLNGIWDRTTGELEPHSPDFLSPVQLNVAFHPEADCPRIKKAIAGIIPKDTLPLIYQVIGLLCTVDIGWQLAFMLLGFGSNGKSTLLRIIAELIGAENLTNLSLHDLANSRFSAAQLYGSLVNIHPDLSPQRLESVSMFKSLTGGDRIYAEHKYSPGFTFQPFTRLVFSANEIPASPDASFAYTRRWCVIPCPNKFNINESFIDELLAPEELSGLFLTGMNAYSRAKDKGELATSESMAKGEAALKEAINPVATFIRDCATGMPEAQVRKSELYEAYRTWCDANGRMKTSAQKFNRQLGYAFPQVAERTLKGWPTWVGIGLLGPVQGDE